MSDADADNLRLQRLREWRNRDKDYTLGFLKDQFKRDVERPYKQLGKLAELWAQHIPEELAAHTRLDGLSRGVLRVTVNGSSRLYELDRCLREGAQAQLIRAFPGRLSRIKLSVGAIDSGE